MENIDINDETGCKYKSVIFNLCSAIRLLYHIKYSVDDFTSGPSSGFNPVLQSCNNCCQKTKMNLKKNLQIVKYLKMQFQNVHH